MISMSEIIPAILAEDFEDLEEKLGFVAGKVAMVHVDVMNSSMTPGKSWPYEGEDEKFLRMTEEMEGFPYWEDMSFEAHLMVNNPEEIVEDWIKVGAERIIVHFESFEDKDALSRFLSRMKNQFSEASSYLGIEVGLAVSLHTPIEDVAPHVLEADFIQLMSIEKLGRQGGKFRTEVFRKVQDLKDRFPEVIISVDGGVNLEAAEELQRVGVNRLVVGSAIFGVEDTDEALYDFLELDHS